MFVVMMVTMMILLLRIRLRHVTPHRRYKNRGSLNFKESADYWDPLLEREAWVVGIFMFIVLILAIVGGMGFQLYKQAEQVQEHENSAIAMLSKLSSGGVETLANAGDTLPQIAHETQQAQDIAHGGLWNAAVQGIRGLLGSTT